MHSESAPIESLIGSSSSNSVDDASSSSSSTLAAAAAPSTLQPPPTTASTLTAQLVAQTAQLARTAPPHATHHAHTSGVSVDSSSHPKLDSEAVREAWSAEPVPADEVAEKLEGNAEEGKEDGEDALQADVTLDDGVEGELEAEVDEVAPRAAAANEAALAASEPAHSQETVAAVAALAARIEEADQAARKVDSQSIMPVTEAQAAAATIQHGHDVSEDFDDDDDEEPSLKYSKLKNGVAEALQKDAASAMAVSDRVLVLGTHGGVLHVLDEQANRVKRFRSHTASILDLAIDDTDEFVGSAGMDGLLNIHSLSSPEAYTFDFQRPMRCLALEPNFGRKSTRAFVCGGLAGNLVMREKSWFGHRETLLHSGEGAIWTVRWKGNYIAWANEKGIRIYDASTKQRIAYISPPTLTPDLCRPSLLWQDDTTLLVAWSDMIKVAKIRDRKKAPVSAAVAQLSAATGSTVAAAAEVTLVLQLECTISGVVPHGPDFLVLAYLAEEPDTDDDAAYRRKVGLRPELRIISMEGEELSSDVLSLQNVVRYGSNDYRLVQGAEHAYVVSPKDVVVARPRDTKDGIEWLLERRRYEEALSRVEKMGEKDAREAGFDAADIGRRYLFWLVEEAKEYGKAAQLAPRLLGADGKAWEDCIFMFVERGRLGTVIPRVPTANPTLSGLVYDMILAHLLRVNPAALLKTLQMWPRSIYSATAVTLAIEDRLDRDVSSKTAPLLMECLVDIFLANRQPGRALPYFLRLRRPDVFDLIRDHNLFTAVQDQALQLVQFEAELKESKDFTAEGCKHGAAINLLVDHTHSIPINRVVTQLEAAPKFLYMYLDALFDRDPQLAVDFADLQVKLYADYEYDKLMPYLRAMSSYYSFEKAYEVCKERDLVPEMVFLLGRVGDNKKALNLIIARLGDVERAIDFAKEQNDDELWEDLLKYSETKPAFIRGLLENVGAEIDPIRLIRRIKNGLEIPGLKPALIKILSDFQLQISLLEGSAAILSHDGRNLSHDLHLSQTHAHYCDSTTLCTLCSKQIFAQTLDTFSAARIDATPCIVFLCRHAYHLSCLLPPGAAAPKVPPLLSPASEGGVLPALAVSASQAHARAGRGEPGMTGIYGPARRARDAARSFERKLNYEARLRVVLRAGCPVCKKKNSGRIL